MSRYDEVTQRAGSLRAMTGLTEPEFTALLPHFERALAASLQDRTIDGQPRTSRRYRAYDHCPLPTMADKLLFILTYVKQKPIQEVQGQLFWMSQSYANQWIHLIHRVLNQALTDQELLPARTAVEFAAMLKTHATDGRSTSPCFACSYHCDSYGSETLHTPFKVLANPVATMCFLHTPYPQLLP